MDGMRFDELARWTGTTASRRRVLGGLAGGALAGAVALLGRGGVEAKQEKQHQQHQQSKAKTQLVRLVAPAMNGQKQIDDNQNPNTGDPDGFGNAHVTIDTKRGKVCLRTSVTGIAAVTEVHIHEGGGRGAARSRSTSGRGATAAPASRR